MLNWLQNWFSSNCDGDWEHDCGIRIETLDNPGWAVFISLDGTPLQNSDFIELSIDRNDHDWIRCRRVGDRFEGFGGACNLEEIIHIFKDWVTDHTE